MNYRRTTSPIRPSLGRASLVLALGLSWSTAWAQDVTLTYLAIRFRVESQGHRHAHRTV